MIVRLINAVLVHSKKYGVALAVQVLPILSYNFSLRKKKAQIIKQVSINMFTNE